MVFTALLGGSFQWRSVLYFLCSVAPFSCNSWVELTGFQLLNYLTSQKSKLYYDRWPVGRSVLVSNNHLGPNTRLLLLSNSCGFLAVGCPDERMCLLFQTAAALTSTVILGSESSRTDDIVYCLRFETPITWRARFLYLYPPGTGWPSYPSRHWVPFLSPPTTCRVMVEVFEPTSMQCLTNSQCATDSQDGPHRRHLSQQFFCCCNT
jgi:hypothetical protein